MANPLRTSTGTAAATTGHNKRLKAAIKALREKVAAARSDDDLVAAIGELDGFPVPVAFDNTALNQFTGAGVLACLVAALYVALNGYPVGYGLAALGLILLVGMAYGAVRMNRRSRLRGLSVQILRLSSLFDYGLKIRRVDPTAEARALAGRFGHFDRGNHKREVTQMLTGAYKGAEHSFDYSYFHFHYVDRRTETYVTTDGKGRTRVRTRTVYDHYNRFGLIVPFPYVKNIHISESSLNFLKGGWKSGSISFNDNFRVEAESDMTAAKFLKPVLIKEIEAAGEALRGMELEFNKAGELCFSFEDATTLHPDQRGSLSDPRAFKAQIKGHNRLGNLDAALLFIHTLMKYSDNNFEPATGAHPATERKASPWQHS